MKKKIAIRRIIRRIIYGLLIICRGSSKTLLEKQVKWQPKQYCFQLEQMPWCWNTEVKVNHFHSIFLQNAMLAIPLFYICLAAWTYMALSQPHEFQEQGQDSALTNTSGWTCRICPQWGFLFHLWGCNTWVHGFQRFGRVFQKIC